MSDHERLAAIKASTEEIGELGAESYMTAQIGATRRDVPPPGVGNRRIPQVYQKEDTYYIVEARGGKGVAETARQMPGEVLGGGSPAYAIIGGEQYLRLMLRDVTEAGGANANLAEELEQALDAGKVVYLMIRTVPQTVPDAPTRIFQTIKRYRIG